MTKPKAWRFFVGVMALALILGVCAVEMAPSPTLANGAVGTWDIQTVDDGNVLATSLALDSNGYPHISYTTGGGVGGVVLTSLHYARWTGTAWAKETVDEVPAFDTSLALDSSNLPHISYTTGGLGSLHYAHWTGAGWAKEEVDDRGVQTCSLALDSYGNPHISYTTGGLLSLHYARWTGAAWVKETVDEVPAFDTSLALDSSNFPHISYTSLGPTSLHYARWTGTAWAKEIVDTVDANSTSIALDSSNFPRISYTTGVGLSSLHYARWTGAAWAKEIVDGSDNFHSTSIALDSSGYPHISYASGGPGVAPLPDSLHYAHWTGSAWVTETVDPRFVGATSIALDSSGYPHISYATGALNSLYYTRLIPPGDMGGTSPGPGVSPTVSHPLNPYDMSLQYMNIHPGQASIGQPVTITTNVVNTGDEGGNYNVTLRINGQVEESKMVSVGPHGTQPVKFTVTKDQPGTYNVDILDKTGSFTIVGAGGTTGSSTGGFIVLALIGALVIATIVVLLIRRS